MGTDLSTEGQKIMAGKFVKGAWVEEERKCPICKSPLRASGKLEMTNPLTQRKRTAQVLVCRMCGYRTLE
jgi:C4-type Zn-finger protein